MTDTEDKIARLERAIRIHTSQITALESDNARLREEIELMGKRKALPYLELVPGSDKIAQVRAELFHNKPKQGVPARVLKLFLWTCVKEQISKYAEGTSQPFYFYMSKPADLVRGDGNSNLEGFVGYIDDDPDHLVGCLNQRRKHGNLKGPRRYLAYGAVIYPDRRLALLLDGEVLDCSTPVPLKEGRSDRASQQVWYFTR